MKVYEIEASIIFELNFEVDGTSQGNARNEAVKQIRRFIAESKIDYVSTEVNVDLVVESEGH